MATGGNAQSGRHAHIHQWQRNAEEAMANARAQGPSDRMEEDAQGEKRSSLTVGQRVINMFSPLNLRRKKSEEPPAQVYA
jgi:hypothetical protein